MLRRVVSLIEMTFVLVLLLLNTGNAAKSANEDTFYDYTICVTTQHLERQFKFKGSQFENKIERLDADVYDKDNEQNSVPYKSLWYWQGKPLGLEMFKHLPVERGHGVCLRIKHKTSNPSEAEKKAAANAILRLWVDARLNQSAVITVKVPGDSFYSIIENLRLQGMDVAAEAKDGEDINESMTLLIESEAIGQKHQRLAYR
ncbi:MAG: hypothetical protein K2X27_09785 [Candidatus Obscuribacterales bacterium]|nr:hypothetical protein [Candidatus Obscuribacterales bacterium]